MTSAELELVAGKWREAFAVPRPDRTLRWYFWANDLTQARIDFEHARLIGLFGRSLNRQMRFRERAEQERYDRQYQERQRQRIEQAKAEQDLEREARKDDWPVPRRKSHSDLVKEGQQRSKSKPKTEPPYHGPRYYEPSARASPADVYSLPRAVAVVLDFGRSDLDLLGDMQLTAPVGFVPSPHSRRRAYFSRWGRSFAPVTLAARRTA